MNYNLKSHIIKTKNYHTIKRGGQLTYTEEVCDKLIEASKRAESIERFLIENEIVPKTFYSWLKKYDELKNAYAYFKLCKINKYKEIGDKIITGEIKGNAQAWQYAMKAYCKIFDETEKNASITVDFDKMPEEQKLKILQEALRRLEQRELLTVEST